MAEAFAPEPMRSVRQPHLALRPGKQTNAYGHHDVLDAQGFSQGREFIIGTPIRSRQEYEPPKHSETQGTK
jgi:hypothetical protein